MLKDLARWTPLTGVAFAVLLFVGAMVGGGSPNADASAQHVVSYFTTHRGHEQAGIFLLVYALVFGLFFAAALRSYLRARTDGDGLGALGLAGMAVLAASGAVAAGITFAAADVPGKISPAAEQALNVLQNDVFFGILVGTGVFLIAHGLAILTIVPAPFPRWLGWAALLFGLVAVTPIGWITLIFALPLWTLIVSVLMLRRPEAGTAPVPAATG